MSKKKSKPMKFGHIVLKDAEHDRHGGIFALCGTYLPASYERDPSPGRPGCLGCLSQQSLDLVEQVGDAHNALADAVGKDLVNIERETKNAIREAVQAATQRWISDFDRATLRIEHLEQRLDKADAKKAKKKARK